MENFEKKIIEFCKEKDGCKFFTGIGIVLTIIAIIVLAIEFIFKIWMPIIYLLVLILMFGCSIFEKVARKIEQTNEEVFFRNKLFYVILSDKSVCDQIFFWILLICTNILLVGIEVTTGSILIDFLVAIIVALGAFLLSEQIAKFFENKLK